MMFWADFPLEQWIEIQEDPYNKHPWSVVIAGFVRAKYTTKVEAEALVDRIHAAFLVDKEMPKPEEIDPLLERPYAPPPLFIFEEVEIGSGYHTLSVTHTGPESGWSEPYRKSGSVYYKHRVVRVEYPPKDSS